MNIYITPDEYAQAAEVGIGEKTLHYRLRIARWPKEEALTKPPRKRDERAMWAEVAKENGISYKRFTNRINNTGWSEEKAATMPVRRYTKCRENEI